MTDEDDRRSFLAAITVDRENDTPRLAFADWLDEHGDADRASFIRCQIKVERGLLPPEQEMYFTAEADRLLNSHRGEWEANIRQTLALSCERVEFRCGFPDEVRVNDVQALHDTRIFETMPLTGLQLANLRDRWSLLLSCPGIDKLTSLNLSRNGIEDADVVVIADSPHLARLTKLNLRSNYIGDVGARTIALSPHLANLTKLNLDFNYIESTGAAAIAGSPHMVNLAELNLRSNNIGDAGAYAIATSPYLTHLTSLNLASTNIGHAGAHAIFTSKTLSIPAKITGLRSASFSQLADQIKRGTQGQGRPCPMSPPP